VACHPWRAPFGSSLRDANNGSRRFFVPCHPWRAPFGPPLARRQKSLPAIFLRLKASQKRSVPAMKPLYLLAALYAGKRSSIF
jgi:hypothetical protein